MTDITIRYDNLVERVMQEIHEGLGGGGWGYSCYGGNEEYHKADELRSAARAAIAVVLEEAAKVVEFSPNSHDAGEMQLMLDKAAAIRAIILR